MYLPDKLIGLIAPHACIGCGVEGSLMCASCREALPAIPSRCYRCHAVTQQFQVCRSCRGSVSLKHMWTVYTYDSHVKELVRRLKFERARAAATDIALALDQALPLLPPGTVVTHIPTAHTRVRVRGYDQAKLIAQEFAQLRGCRHRTLLGRKTAVRQVGSKRTDRFAHMKDAFYSLDSANSTDSVLIVDDVLTTGATMESAAGCLRSAGVRTIDGVVFAH